MSRHTWICTYHDGTVYNGERTKFSELDRSKVATFRVMNWVATSLPLGYCKRSKITVGRGVVQVAHIMVMLDHVIFCFEIGKSIVRRETFDQNNHWFRPIQYKQPFFFP